MLPPQTRQLLRDDAIALLLGGFPLSVIDKDVLPAATPVHDVVDGARKLHSHRARHGAQGAKPDGNVNQRNKPQQWRPANLQFDPSQAAGQPLHNGCVLSIRGRNIIRSAISDGCCFTRLLMQAERIVKEEIKRLGWDEDELVARRKGQREKVILARRLCQETTMSLKWIAQRLHMGSWTCVSNLLKELPPTPCQAQEMLPLCQ